METGLDVTTYSFVSLRMAQAHDNPKNLRTAFDFSVFLTDADGQQSVVDARDFGFTVPPSYRRDDARGASVAGESNKSHFKTETGRSASSRSPPGPAARLPGTSP